MIHKHHNLGFDFQLSSLLCFQEQIDKAKDIAKFSLENNLTELENLKKENANLDTVDEQQKKELNRLMTFFKNATSEGSEAGRRINGQEIINAFINAARGDSQKSRQPNEEDSAKGWEFAKSLGIDLNKFSDGPVGRDAIVYEPSVSRGNEGVDLKDYSYEKENFEQQEARFAKWQELKSEYVDNQQEGDGFSEFIKTGKISLGSSVDHRETFYEMPSSSEFDHAYGEDLSGDFVGLASTSGESYANGEIGKSRAIRKAFINAVEKYAYETNKPMDEIMKAFKEGELTIDCRVTGIRAVKDGSSAEDPIKQSSLDSKYSSASSQTMKQYIAEQAGVAKFEDIDPDTKIPYGNNGCSYFKKPNGQWVYHFPNATKYDAVTYLDRNGEEQGDSSQVTYYKAYAVIVPSDSWGDLRSRRGRQNNIKKILKREGKLK